MRYIATREGVEKLVGNGSVTKGQRELIQKLLTDFPDAVELFEYEPAVDKPRRRGGKQMKTYGEEDL